MANGSRKTVAAVLVIVLGFVAAIALTRSVEQTRPALPDGYADEDLGFEGSRMKGFAFGAEGLMADWYWMNSLQYMGGKISRVGLSNLNLDDLRPLNPRLLYPYLNNASDLDPRFMAPYSYGAAILPSIEPAHAIAITEKGIANNPDKWRLYQFLGYIYWQLKDYEKAADAYERGSRISGAPEFFKLMAAKVRSDGGSRDTAREIYRRAIAESVDRQTKASAGLRIMQLDALDEMEIMNKALSGYRGRIGRCANSWSGAMQDLRSAFGAARRDFRVDASNSPVDPSGVPYRLNQEKCQAEINWPNSSIPPQ